MVSTSFITWCMPGFLRSISFSANSAPSERRCTSHTTPKAPEPGFFFFSNSDLRGFMMR